MILAAMIGVAVAIKFLLQDAGRQEDIDRILLKSPILGDIFRKIAVARFSRTLSTLLSSGVPILQSLDITAKTSGNVIIEEAITKVRTGVERGESFVDPLKATEVFPHMVAQMIGIGEQTGALDAMLGKIADFYEAEVDSAIANLLTLMEPLLIGFLGVTIGSIVIAMYLPLFTLIGKLSQGIKALVTQKHQGHNGLARCAFCASVVLPNLAACYNPLTPADPFSTLLQNARESFGRDMSSKHPDAGPSIEISKKKQSITCRARNWRNTGFPH